MNTNGIQGPTLNSCTSGLIYTTPTWVGGQTSTTGDGAGGGGSVSVYGDGHSHVTIDGKPLVYNGGKWVLGHAEPAKPESPDPAPHVLFTKCDNCGCEARDIEAHRPNCPPRGRPFQFTTEMLEALAALPQAPDDDYDSDAPEYVSGVIPHPPWQIRAQAEANALEWQRVMAARRAKWTRRAMLAVLAAAGLAATLVLGGCNSVARDVAEKHAGAAGKHVQSVESLDAWALGHGMADLAVVTSKALNSARASKATADELVRALR